MARPFARDLPKAGLLMVDMLLNLVIMIVLIANVMATRNRIESSAVSPVSTAAFEVTVSWTTDSESGDGASELIKRGFQPKVEFEFTGPAGNLRSDQAHTHRVGAAALRVRDRPLGASGNTLIAQFDVVLVGPDPGAWSVKTLLLNDQPYRLYGGQAVLVTLGRVGTGAAQGPAAVRHPLYPATTDDHVLATKQVDFTVERH